MYSFFGIFKKNARYLHRLTYLWAVIITRIYEREKEKEVDQVAMDRFTNPFCFVISITSIGGIVCPHSLF